MCCIRWRSAFLPRPDAPNDKTTASVGHCPEHFAPNTSKFSGFARTFIYSMFSMIAPRPEIELKIDRWVETLVGFEPLPDSAEQRECQHHALPQTRVLAEIFEEFKRRAKINAKWKDWSLSAWRENMSTHHKTLRTSCSFDLSFYDGREISLRSHLVNHTYLRFATDKFWIELARLCDETHLTWDTNEFPIGYDKSEANRSLFKTQKSVFFCMMRNYLVGVQQDDWKSGIGSFSLGWMVSGDWHKMLEEGGKAVERIYNLNYHLWRWHYQTVYRNLKKLASKEGFDFKTALTQYFPHENGGESEEELNS